MYESSNLLKARLARGETTLGMWVTLESPSITEIAVTLGIDWVVIDTEHGHLDYKEVVEHIRATRHSATPPGGPAPRRARRWFPFRRRLRGSSSGSSTWEPTGSSSRKSARPRRPR